MSGVLNPKMTKQKNIDFRLKLEAWKNRKTERKNLKKRWFEHGKALRKSFEESKSLFNMDRNLLLECIDKYNVFCDDNTKVIKEAKTINNFLCDLPGGNHISIEIGDLEKL